MSRYLPDLATAGERRLNYLASLLPTPGDPFDRGTHRNVSFVLTELGNLWGGFCRTFYLSSCIGAIDGQGTKIATSLTSRTTAAALTSIIHLKDQRTRQRTGPWSHRDEPDWFPSRTLLDGLQHVSASNYGPVSSALSASVTFLADLPTARNFVAHRSRSAALKVRRLALRRGVRADIHPVATVLEFAPGRNQSLLADWLSEIRQVVPLVVN